LEGGAYLERTCAVGLYPHEATPDGGLLDMSGNVWEWCTDVHDGEREAESPWTGGRVLRGGSWLSNPRSLRASIRGSYRPDGASNDIGFRVCRASPI
jgi:formylglycine-generating enzyme required for sulfatase activity